MEAYDLKDSGVEFLGKIPTHWRATKLKNIGHCVLGVTYKPEDTIQEETGHLVLRSSNIQNGKLCLNDCVYIKKGIASPKQIVNIGDILICSRNGSRNLIGKNIKICESLQGETFGAFMTIFRSKFSSKYNDFIYYFFNSTVFDAQSGLYMSATINQLTTRTLSNFAIALPPIEEQKFITNYLNKACQNIDKTITLKQQQLDKLEAYRKSVIHEAVTKGLDKTVPMKDSGVEWLGKINSFWKVVKLKRILSEKLQYGANESAELEDKSLPRYIRITDFGADGKLRDNTFKSLEESVAAPYMLKNGDVLFARSGATVGKTFQFKNYQGKACFAGYLIKAAPLETKISSDFLYYFTKSIAYDEWKNLIFTQATIQNIGADKYQYLNVPLPLVDEQNKITLYLDKACANIDKTKETIAKQIKTLTQYRQSLIHECVTGKKRIYQGETQ